MVFEMVEISAHVHLTATKGEAHGIGGRFGQGLSLSNIHAHHTLQNPSLNATD